MQVGQSGTILFGTYFHGLDEKCRLVIPSKFREFFFDHKAYLLKGHEGSIEIYNSSTFANLIEKASTLNSNVKDQRDYQRTLLKSVVELDVDSKNRIQLTNQIIKKYDLSTKLAIIGLIDHIEVWSEDKWNIYEKELDEHFDEKAEDMFND